MYQITLIINLKPIIMKTWIHAQNTFLNATDNSFLNAMAISTYHNSALAAALGDPFILDLFNSFNPLHLNLKTAYDTWISQGGMQQGETLNLRQLLELLSNTKIQQWDIKIQNIYPQNTPQYKKLLPGRRKPFQNGKQSERIHAVQALSQSIGDDKSLAEVKVDIDSFYEQIDSSHSQQKGSLSTSKNTSSDLEAARVAMCIGQFANLGALIQKYAATPEKIEQYFDLQAIRSSKQVLFTGHVKPGAVYTIVKHTFGEADEVILVNPGQAPLKFYLASGKDMQPNSVFVSMGNGEQTVLASSLGKLTDTYLTVFNTDPSQIGEFNVEIL